MTRNEYLLIRRLAAKRGAITRKINKLVGDGVSLNDDRITELVKRDCDLEYYIAEIKAIIKGNYTNTDILKELQDLEKLQCLDCDALVLKTSESCQCCGGRSLAAQVFGE
jgi:hypothetical protein